MRCPALSCLREACGAAARWWGREPGRECRTSCSSLGTAAGLLQPPTPQLPSPPGSGRWSMGITGTQPRSSSKRRRRNGARGQGLLEGVKTRCEEGGLDQGGSGWSKKAENNRTQTEPRALWVAQKVGTSRWLKAREAQL